MSSIYIHWPYCLSKCPYCGFFSLPCGDKSSFKTVEKYLLEDLKIALDSYAINNVKTVFFGGGTPTLMSTETIYRILNYVQKECGFNEDYEITIEANPATFDKHQLTELRNAGVNRLSVGIQSFSSKNLNFLGRTYNGDQALSAAEIASSVFDNLSFDFIYGYQGQTLDDLARDLQLSLDFNCKHISCYQLSFEENTPFFEMLQNSDIDEVNGDTQVGYYDFIEDFLDQHGIYRYEISNYAKLSFESKHNLAYWNYDEYLGIGPGAHSRLCIGKKRYEIIRTNDISAWIDGVKKMETPSGRSLSETEQLEEIIIMGLRLKSGIDIKSLRSKIADHLVDKLLTRVEFLRKMNLIQPSLDTIILTKDGSLKLNSVVEYLVEEL